MRCHRCHKHRNRPRHSQGCVQDYEQNFMCTPEQLRSVLRRFCYDLEDKQFAAVMKSFNDGRGVPSGSSASKEIPYERFMQHFGRVSTSYCTHLTNDTPVPKARAVIREAIESKIEGGDGSLLRAFKLFDRDRSGAFSYKDFAKILRDIALISMEPGLHNRVMASYDTDGDGTIDYGEFVQQVMVRQPPCSFVPPEI